MLPPLWVGQPGVYLPSEAMLSLMPKPGPSCHFSAVSPHPVEPQFPHLSIGKQSMCFETHL